MKHMYLLTITFVSLYTATCFGVNI